MVLLPSWWYLFDHGKFLKHSWCTNHGHQTIDRFQQRERGVETDQRRTELNLQLIRTKLRGAGQGVTWLSCRPTDKINNNNEKVKCRVRVRVGFVQNGIYVLRKVLTGSISSLASLQRAAFEPTTSRRTEMSGRCTGARPLVRLTWWARHSCLANLPLEKLQRPTSAADGYTFSPPVTWHHTTYRDEGENITKLAAKYHGLKSIQRSRPVPEGVWCAKPVWNQDVCTSQSRLGFRPAWREYRAGGDKDDYSGLLFRGVISLFARIFELCSDARVVLASC